jgi:phage host-nuclease inhibitor protein Gam
VSAEPDFDIDDTDEWVEVENEETTITGQDVLERMIRHLGHLEREQLEAIAHRDAAIAQYTAEANDWADRKIKRLKNTSELIKYRISSWYLDYLEANPKAPKTLDLIAGSIKKKRPTDVVVVEDAKAFLAWDQVKRHALWSVWDRPRFTRRPEPRPPTPAVDKDGIKAAWKKGALIETAGVLVDALTGEVVPGVVLEHHTDDVDITPRGK